MRKSEENTQTSEYKTILDRLAACGEQDDKHFDPAQAALLLAALNHPGLSLERYDNHLSKLCDETAARYKELQEAGADDSAETRLAALKHIMVDKHGYRTPEPGRVNLIGDDLIETIKNGKGAAPFLAIIYLHIARSLGWAIDILSIPGAFILRLSKESTRLIFDPADDCRVLQAPDLRALVKRTLGQQAELSADYYDSVSPRDFIIGFNNIVKIRLIENEEYKAALSRVEAMRLLAPDEYRLLLDAGLLLARCDRPYEAIVALEAYIEKAPDPRDRHDAALILQQIKQVLP